MLRASPKVEGFTIFWMTDPLLQSFISHVCAQFVPARGAVDLNIGWPAGSWLAANTYEQRSMLADTVLHGRKS